MAIVTVFFATIFVATLGRFGINGLICQECENIEVSNDLLNMKTKTNPGCKRGTSYRQVQCPTDGVYACVYIQGQGTVREPILGSTTVKIEARSCSPRLTGESNGCSRADQSNLGFVKELLSVSNVDISGMYCECDTDLCTAGCSGFYVKDMCLVWWMVGAIGAGVLLALILLCTSCCCCCGCCRCCGIHGCCDKERPAVTVVQAPAAPGTYVRLQSPIGESRAYQDPVPGKTTIVGIENPYHD